MPSGGPDEHLGVGRPDRGVAHSPDRAGPAHQVTLSVRDTGVGFPPAFDVRRTDSLGLKLVSMLTEQLEGTITLECDGGTTLTLAFPLPLSEMTR